MKKKGYTLIEIFASLFIISLISLVVYNFIHFNNTAHSRMETKINCEGNLRIAVDLIYENMIKARQVVIKNNELILDSQRFYIRNNILRLGSDSQQIASGITGLGAQKLSINPMIYKVTVYSYSQSQSTYVLNRGDYYN